MVLGVVLDLTGDDCEGAGLPDWEPLLRLFFLDFSVEMKDNCFIFHRGVRTIPLLAEVIVDVDGVLGLFGGDADVCWLLSAPSASMRMPSSSCTWWPTPSSEWLSGP